MKISLIIKILVIAGLIAVTEGCPWITQLYVDNNDGTISIAGDNLTWLKCSQVDTSGKNTYNASSNDCSNGSPGLFKYCSVPLNDCDNGAILDGSGSSEVYTTCANLTLAGRSWRVPTYDELVKLSDDSISGQNIDLPDAAHTYWTADSSAISLAWTVAFGRLLPNFAFIKTSNLRVRCVSDGS